MSVDGQSLGQALWGAATHDSLLGQFYTFFTNQDLETGTYQGLAWDQRLGLLADGVAQVVAARAGVRFGQFATGARCGLIRSCFVGGTPILTPDGAKAIEDLKVGDWVLSRDEYDEHGAVEAKRIEEVFVRHSKVMWLVIGDQRIGTTSEHPFWVVGKGWLSAGDVIGGDILVGHDGQQVVVSSKEAGEWATVYNMRVADWHTYFVGCAEWGWSAWAHNANCYSDWLKANKGVINAARSVGESFNKAASRLWATKKAVKEVGDDISRWLGPDPVLIRDSSGSFNLMSQDRLRMMRLDIHGHGYPPHGHLQVRDRITDPFRDAIPGRHHLPFSP